MESLAIERRRYSSVLIRDPSLDGLAAFKRLAGDLADEFLEIECTRPGWRVYRFGLIHNRSLYPSHLVDPRTLEREKGFAHATYLAVRDGGQSSSRLVVIASPYIYLLDKLTVRLEYGSRGNRRLKYCAVDMPRLYKEVGGGMSGLSATRVTLQIRGEPNLELVSLSGRNPLHSKLHNAIKSVAKPYAIRAQLSESPELCRLSIDHHGNVHWYQADETKIESALGLIERLRELDVLLDTDSRPLDKVDDEDASS